MRRTIHHITGMISILICLLLASCDSGPIDPGEMLSVVLSNTSNKTDKAMNAYKKSGPEGRTALIRVFFDIEPKGEAYYQRIRNSGIENRSFDTFVEKLSEDPEFLRAILATSDTKPRDPFPWSERRKLGAATATWSSNPVYKRPNELEWVLSRDEGIYASWIATLPITDPRLGTAWELYIKRHPDKGIDAFLGMLTHLPVESTIAGTRYLLEVVQLCASLAETLTPAQLRVIFINRLDSRFLSLWKPDAKGWLLAFPADFGFALWRDESETIQLKLAIPWEKLREGVITPERGKALVFFSDPENEFSLSPDLMRKALTKENAADSLYGHDRQILVSLFRTTLFSYYVKGGIGGPTLISGVRSDLTVTCIESQGGKKIWTKVFQGGEPPKETGAPVGRVDYVSGSLPWEETYAAIQECVTR